MERLKKNQGITLIALVITIIVLLILAGISIQGLTGNGIFEKTKQAIEKSKYAGALEKVKLAVTASYDETGNINNEYLYENLDNIDGKEELKESEEENAYLVKVDGYYFLVSKSTGEVKRKDIEIADGGVDNSREIDEEEYNTLKDTVSAQNQIISNQANKILSLETNLGTLTNTVTSLQNTVNTLSKVELIGTVSKNNVMNFNASEYKVLNLITVFKRTTDNAVHSGSETVSVASLTTDYTWLVNSAEGGAVIIWWGVKKGSLYCSTAMSKSVEYIDNATTYVYGIK